MICLVTKGASGLKKMSLGSKCCRIIQRTVAIPVLTF